MKRIVARFENEDDADAAEMELRDAGLEPERPTFDNPFFDPTAQIPEARGILVGGIVGGLLGLVLFQAINAGWLWIPRLSPLMSAGEYAVPVLGLGLGGVFGAFVGGVIGTLRPIREPADTEVAVKAPDSRVEEATEMLRNHDAETIEGSVTYHENPSRVTR